MPRLNRHAKRSIKAKADQAARCGPVEVAAMSEAQRAQMLASARRRSLRDP